MREENPNSGAAQRPAPTLDDLAARASKGDENAFEELHRRLGGGLRRFLARRVGKSPDTTEDLAQATWVEVWRAVRNGRYDSSRARISTFVYAVGYKIALRNLRAVQRGRRFMDSADLWDGTVSQDADVPGDLVHACELLDELRECLWATGRPENLSDEERRIVVAAANGESERGLAEKMGLAASTIHARKASAYQKLRKCLAGKGFSDERVERGGLLGE